MNIRRTLAVAIVLMVACESHPPVDVGDAWPPDALVQPGPLVVLTGTGTATVDGALSPGEWSFADQLPVFPNGIPGAVFYVMNDADNLYLALTVPDATEDPADIMEVRFDNALNFVIDDGDDELNASPGRFVDGSFLAAVGAWGIPDAQQDGSSASTNNGSTTTFEIAHPLNSGDARDIAAVVGDVIGFCLRYFEDGLATSFTQFPEDCSLTVNAQFGYAGIEIAEATVLVDIDILPHRPGNLIEVPPDRPGILLPVAILTSETFDAAAVDPTSVTLGDGIDPDVGVALKLDGSPRYDLLDIDQDGDVDMVVLFGLTDLLEAGELEPGTTALVLRGTTTGGTDFMGQDAVNVQYH